VLVTGATSGIGLELAGLLIREGFRVFGGALPGEDADALAQTGAALVSLDVTDRASVAAAADEVAKRLAGEPLFGLVNNAGIVGAGPVELLDLDEARRIFEVNVLGVLATTRAFLPSIRAARGRIVNVSSLSGLLAVPFLGPYNASKAAIESLSDALRRELLPFGVEVIVIQPGTTRTPLWRKAGEIDRSPFAGSPYEAALDRVQREAVRKGGKGMPPQQVARAMLRALTAERPPTRIRVQRKRSSYLKYSLIPLLPDRFIDGMVKKRVWEE
jgi:NAD(P)-dependent dehydrogenase (short-subunit alcohol dehydrogenase family)